MSITLNKFSFSYIIRSWYFPYLFSLVDGSGFCNGLLLLEIKKDFYIKIKKTERDKERFARLWNSPLLVVIGFFRDTGFLEGVYVWGLLCFQRWMDWVFLLFWGNGTTTVCGHRASYRFNLVIFYALCWTFTSFFLFCSFFLSSCMGWVPLQCIKVLSRLQQKGVSSGNSCSRTIYPLYGMNQKGVAENDTRFSVEHGAHVER